LSLRARLLDRAPDGWSALLELDPDATPGHRPELWQAFAAGGSGFEPRVIVVEEEGALRGGMPLAIERRGGLAWIRALPSLLPAAPLSSGGPKGDVDLAVARALGDLQREIRACGGEWACYRPAGEPVAEAALSQVRGETRWMECARIDLSGGIDAALRAMDRKTRQEVARARHPAITFEEAPGALDEAYALHVHQSRAWRHRPLPIELSRRLLDSGAAQLLCAHDARGVLCAALALDGPNETFLWWSGSHPGARASEVFPALMWWAAEWAAARGRARLNLGASRGLERLTRFKLSLGAKPFRYPIRWLDASAAPPLGKLAAAVQRRLRRGRARGDEA